MAHQGVPGVFPSRATCFRTNGSTLAGVVTRQAVISAYNSEILKRDTFSEVLGGISSAEDEEPVVLSNGVAIAEIEAPGWMVGKTHADLNLRKTHDTLVLLISKEGASRGQTEQIQIVPHPDYSIQLGDILLVLGSKDTINRLKR